MGSGVHRLVKPIRRKVKKMMYGKPAFLDPAKQLPRLPREVLSVERKDAYNRFVHNRRIRNYRRKDLVGRKRSLQEYSLSGDTSVWTYYGRSLKVIQRELRFDFASAIKGVRAKRLEQLSKTLLPSEAAKRSVVRVMELGCGPGTALNTLKEHFGESIHTTGLVLEKTPGEKYAGVDRVEKGDFTNLQINRRFDLVYSSMGPTHHTKYPLNAVQKVIDILAPNGVAVVDLNLFELNKPKLRTLLAQNGYKEKDYSLKEVEKGLGVLILRKRTPKLPA